MRLIKMNYIKNTTKIVGALALTAMLGACKPSSLPSFIYGSYNGYAAIVMNEKNYRSISLSDESANYKGKLNPCLSAHDFNGDGQFERIDMNNVPKGHVFEQYDCLSTLEDAFQKVVSANHNH